jgi:L-fucose mutarotase
MTVCSGRLQPSDLIVVFDIDASLSFHKYTIRVLNPIIMAKILFLEGGRNMLNRIPPIISPDLMHVMMSMGHGDELVLADGNFPAAKLANRLVRADGHGTCEVLRAIMQFFPLDTYVDDPAVVMNVVPGDDVKPVIWEEYRTILSDAAGNDVELAGIERYEFYRRSREAFAVVATAESALYANLILVKGVVTKDSN